MATSVPFRTPRSRYSANRNCGETARVAIECRSTERLGARYVKVGPSTFPCRLALALSKSDSDSLLEARGSRSTCSLGSAWF